MKLTASVRKNVPVRAGIVCKGRFREEHTLIFAETGRPTVCGCPSAAALYLKSFLCPIPLKISGSVDGVGGYRYMQEYT